MMATEMERTQKLKICACGAWILCGLLEETVNGERV